MKSPSSKNQMILCFSDLLRHAFIVTGKPKSVEKKKNPIQNAVFPKITFLPFISKKIRMTIKPLRNAADKLYRQAN